MTDNPQPPDDEVQPDPMSLAPHPLPRRNPALTPDEVDNEFNGVIRFLDGSARCTAHNVRGDPCGQPVVGPGAGVCRIHGGSAPQVREAALTRLTIARDTALDKLITQLSSNGDLLDPRTLLDIVTRLTDKTELLAGRATERTESTEFKLTEVRATLTKRLDNLKDSYARAPMVLDMVDRMMEEADGDAATG